MGRVDEEDGVTLPFLVEAVDGLPYGVTRPVEADGVMRPDDEAIERPPWNEATEEGRDPDARTLTVGGDNLVVATKTPHLGAQSKYRFLSDRESARGCWAVQISQQEYLRDCVY